MTIDVGRGIRWGASSSLVLGGLAVITSLTAPVQFVSSARVQLSGYEPFPYSSAEVETITFRMVDDFADGFSFPSAVEGALDRLGRPRADAEHVSKSIVSRPFPGSTYVIVSVAASSPGEAHDLLEALLAVRIELHEKRENAVLQRQAMVFDDAIIKARATLADVNGQLSGSLYRDDSAAALSATYSSQVIILKELTKAAAAVKFYELMKESKQLGIGSQVARGESVFDSPENLRNSAVSAIRLKQLDQKAALAAMGAISGTASPRYRLALAAAAATETDATRLLESQLDKAKASLDSLTPIGEALKREQGRLREELVAYGRNWPKNESIRVVKTSLEAALAQLIFERESLDSSKAFRQALFTIEEPPNLPTSPERPRPALTIVAALLAGSLIGAIAHFSLHSKMGVP